MSDLCPTHYKATRVQKIDEQVDCVACNAYSDGYTEADRIANKELERLRAAMDNKNAVIEMGITKIDDQRQEIETLRAELEKIKARIKSVADDNYAWLEYVQDENGECTRGEYIECVRTYLERDQ